jgi:hypothetical protein
MLEHLAPLGGMERPRRKVRFARLIQRRVRAFWRTFGPRRLRRQSEPALVATQGGTAFFAGSHFTIRWAVGEATKPASSELSTAATARLVVSVPSNGP